MENDLEIPGIAGRVRIEPGFWTGPKLFINGERVKTRFGFGKRTFTTPSTDGGTVEGSFKAQMWTVHPPIEVAGKVYSTGENPPTWLGALAVVPPFLLMIANLATTGGSGILVVVLILMANLGLLRTSLSNGAKAGLIVLVSTAILWVTSIIGAAILATVD